MGASTIECPKMTQFRMTQVGALKVRTVGHFHFSLQYSTSTELVRKSLQKMQVITGSMIRNKDSSFPSGRGY